MGCSPSTLKSAADEEVEGGDALAVPPAAVRSALKHDGTGTDPRAPDGSAAAGGGGKQPRSVRISSQTSSAGGRPSGSLTWGTIGLVERLVSTTLLGGSRTNLHADLVQKVDAVHQSLSLIRAHPLLALTEAAEALQEQLGADVVGIYAFEDEDQPDCAGLLAACGDYAAVLESTTVLRVGDGSATNGWSAARIAGGALPSGRLLVSDAASRGEVDLPDDLALLHKEGGLRSFAAVSIGHWRSPMGVLVLGKSQPGGFDERGTRLVVGAAATAMLQHVRAREVSQVVRVLRAVDGAEDPVSAISALLQSGSRYLYRATNVQMGLRLALFDRGRPSAPLLVFESARASASKDDPSISTRSVVLDRDPSSDITVREVKAEETLLASAVAQKQARFVKDCAGYVQNCPKPARDVFTPNSQLVSSLVVVPLLLGDGEALGGLYLTQDRPCDFRNIKDHLLGFVHCVTMTLFNKLSGQMTTLRKMVDEVESAPLPELPFGAQAAAVRHRALPARSASVLSAASSVPSDAHLAHGAAAPPGASSASAAGGMLTPAASFLADEAHAAASAAAAAGGRGPNDPPCLSPVPAAARLSKVSSRRLCTEAMFKVLRHEVRRGALDCSRAAVEHDLVLLEAIGRGGFATVYRGTWFTFPAAIKILNARSSDSEAVSDAMEMAVLSSVQHPNIVQAYACLTDMIEIKNNPDDSTISCTTPAGSLNGAAAAGAGGAGGSSSVSLPVVNTGSHNGSGGRLGLSKRFPRYRHAHPGEEMHAPTYNIVVMEFCDRGTLQDAVQCGVFHSRLPSGALGINLMAVIDVLLDVSFSLQYLHRSGLVHSDVKSDNVLLKSDTARHSGVVPKLADFGLARIVKDADDAINHSGAGTVTHLAPEMFRAGTRITAAVDVYSFGIMMWEMFTAQKAYAGLTREVIISRVVTHGARPHFPGGTPRPYASLAADCWRVEPEGRPSSAEVTSRLQAMLGEFQAAQQAPRPPAPRGPVAAAGSASA